jgi:hypothetical protein
MSNNEDSKRQPISTVRFGIGKEIQLYFDELVVTAREEDKETRFCILHLSGGQHRRLSFAGGGSPPLLGVPIWCSLFLDPSPLAGMVD